MSEQPADRTILLVDDEATERRLLYHALKSEFRVLEAADGASAIEQIGRGGVDLVVLDLHLPPDSASPRGGIRLHEAIRRTAPRLPVVVATSSDDDALRIEMKSRGVAAYLRKPVSRPRLVDALHHAMAVAAARGEGGGRALRKSATRHP